MKLAIFGGRTICDDDAKEELRQLIKEANPTAIVTAAQPEGVCALARELAQELVLPLHLHFLDPHRAQGMHEWRSVAVYNDCDHVILMHDGESRGTQNELKLAIKMSVNRTNYVVILLAVPEHWDDFAAKNTNEVRQVINRCQAVLRFDTIPATDVDAFLGPQFVGDRKAACRAIAAAANQFGAYKTVKRACNLINTIDGATDTDIAKAIQQVRFSPDK